jgi:hypothetical protein
VDVPAHHSAASIKHEKAGEKLAARSGPFRPAFACLMLPRQLFPYAAAYPPGLLASDLRRFGCEDWIKASIQSFP